MEPAPEVLDGELITEAEYQQRTRLRRVTAVVIRGADRTRGATAAVAPRVAPPARVLARVIYTVGAGHVSWARRAAGALTHAPVREQIRRARKVGDPAALAEWTERLVSLKDKRAKRLQQLPKTLLGVAKGLLAGLCTLAGLLLLTSVWVTLSPGGMGWGDWWSLLGDIANGISTVTSIAVTVATWIALPAWLLAAWWEGRSRGSGPSWALSPTQRDEESVIITPMGIAEALAHLGIPALDKAIKGGWTVAFYTPPVRVNKRGYQTVFSLPMGVTPDMIANKGDVLARNLHRAPLETWPAASERPGYVDLWVADPGATEKPAPQYPLLHAGVCDVFAGVPLGVSQRGDVIAPPLVQHNMVFGSLMGQGKSNAARVTMLGAALDPLAELWVYVFANNGDFDAYRPRLARYDKGVDDTVCAAALGSLHEFYAEVGRREQRIAELGAKKVTRTVAERHPDLRPIAALFSECHELFGHEEFGKEAADVATKTLRRARKTAITLMFDTQSSRADATPPKIVELVAINACFAVKTWRSNDGFLGDGSFQAGIRATELRAGKDKGTSVLTGATPERFEILKWFFVEVNDDTGYDAAADVIARALDSLHPAVPALGDRPRIGLPAPRCACPG